MGSDSPTFEQRFGPRQPWPVSHPQHDVAGTCNGSRAGFLDGEQTTWGWFANLPGDEDWEERAKAWELALRLHQLVEQLRWESEASVPFTPFVTRLPAGAELRERLKPALGMSPAEKVEYYSLGDDSVEGEEGLAFELFFGSDALEEGVEEYFGEDEAEIYREVAATMGRELLNPCRVRFDQMELSQLNYVVSPVLWVGTTSGGYAAGLWAYEVRT